jgi:divalent metal cation (Fe/Co/Zn/Cd) transporter
MQPEADAGRVREVSKDLEKTLKNLVRGSSRVIIHIEPEERA